jgi:hypothetical protein
MSYQVFVSCSLWPQDVSAIEPIRELIHSTEKIPWTVGIDEKVEDDKALSLIARRIRESEAVVVVHTHRYNVNGHLSSLWLQREPIIAAIMGKPVLEFYESGIRKECLLRDVSINQIEFNRYELLNVSGRNRIKSWLEHFWWHIDLHRYSWIPMTTIIGAIGGGAASRRFGGVLAGGAIGFIIGIILDQFKPVCKSCPRTYPPCLAA